MGKNENSQYDADVTINCGLNEASSTLNDLVNISVSPSNFTLESNEIVSGELKVVLNGVLIDDTDVAFTCELVATPIEREETGVITPVLYEDESMGGTDPVISKDLVPV